MLRKHETRLCAWIDDMIGVLSREGFVDGLMEKYLGPSEAVGR